MRCILLSEKQRHLALYQCLKIKFDSIEWIHIDKLLDFTEENLKVLRPDYIFIPHWSHIIPEAITDNFQCVIFHMTDLPYGRGGSPLQNLIVRGHENTQVSALRASKGMDTGPIYLKHPLSLEGTAEEIFERCTWVIQDMIGEIIQDQLSPNEQIGEVVNFKRRKPEDGNIYELDSEIKIFNHIRMLDAIDYPKAFIETKEFVLEFTQAKLDQNNKLSAHVHFIKK